jgi:hypothetical protein
MFNITNYFDHPTRPGYTVFKFYDKQRSNYFEELLNDQNIWYELSSEEGENKNVYLFGIRKGDEKKALKANYLVSGKYRKPTIANLYIRLIIFTISLTVIVLAILGALKS